MSADEGDHRASAAPVDRTGAVNGTLLHVMVGSEPASFQSRSLPSDAVSLPYAQHRLQALPIGWSSDVGEVAPWFGQPGGATQLFVLDGSGAKVRIADLLRIGVLA